MKEHQTFNQQMRILRTRGMTVSNDGKPKRFLEQENYYNVINGYKDLFLLKDANNRPIEPEKYIQGTNFDELKSLFLFDRELRAVLLKYLLIFENSVKTTIAYEFSKRYPNKNAYLDISNFVDNEPKKVLHQISILTKTIHDRVGREGAVKHYIEKHGEVPLWVLVNFMTIGNMAYFYDVLTDSLQNDIVKFYSDKYNKEYKPANSLKLTSQDLSACLKVINLTRNICAHDERLYNVNLKNVRIAGVAHYYELYNIDNKKLVVVFLFLKTVLDKSYFQKFYSDFETLCETYQRKFKTISFDDIIKSMGIDLIELQKLK